MCGEGWWSYGGMVKVWRMVELWRDGEGVEDGGVMEGW